MIITCRNRLTEKKIIIKYYNKKKNIKLIRSNAKNSTLKLYIISKPQRTNIYTDISIVTIIITFLCYYSFYIHNLFLLPILHLIMMQTHSAGNLVAPAFHSRSGESLDKFTHTESRLYV